MRRFTSARRRGFTLFELCITVMIIGIIGVIVVPIVNATTTAPGLRTAANMLMSDVEYVESACISTPQALRVLRVDTGANKYWVADSGSTETPVADPADGQPYINDFATGRTSRLNGVSVSSVTGVAPVLGSYTSYSIVFDAYGRPTGSSGNNIVITLSAPGGQTTMTITIDGGTGEVSIAG